MRCRHGLFCPDARAEEIYFRLKVLFNLQRWPKKCVLGCVKSPRGRGGITQPRTNFFVHLCIELVISLDQSTQPMYSTTRVTLYIYKPYLYDSTQPFLQVHKEQGRPLLSSQSGHWNLERRRRWPLHVCPRGRSLSRLTPSPSAPTKWRWSSALRTLVRADSMA